MIVDTSVWVDFFRGVATPQTGRLRQQLASGTLLYITATILQEVLQGIREDTQFKRVQDDLLACVVLQLNPVDAAVGAAQLYRTGRKRGITIRKANDCLIAHYAIFYDLSLLHSDADFDQIAGFTALRVAAT